MSALKVAIESIMQIVPYKPGKSKVEGKSGVIKLSSNENPLGSSYAAKKAISDAGKKLNLYPDGGSIELRKAIGKKFDLDPEKLVCGAGSDELITLICQAYAPPGSEVLYSQYGFLMYPISAQIVGAIPVTADETNYRTDIENIINSVTDKTSIVFIANPNNPTGSYISEEELKSLRERLPENVLLVIDGAYAEYVVEDDYNSGESIVNSSNNTIMLRTFSKLYGLASLRLGWAYASAEIIDVLNRVRGPFNVSGVSQEAGVASLEDDEFLNKAIEHNLKWKQWLTDELNSLGLEVLPSVANFVLVKFSADEGKNVEAADEFLRGKGIIGRRMEAYKLPDFMRFTIGTDEQNETLVKVLKEFLS